LDVFNATLISREDFDMNVKTLVLGLLVGGMVSFGTYFFLPPPQSAKASDCATSYELSSAVDDIKSYVLIMNRRYGN
jgi:hypothetical protein